MSSYSYNHPLFGYVTYETAHTPAIFGDDITFTSGFNTDDLSMIHIPQLAGITNFVSTIYFHNKAHNQLLSAFMEIENEGLLHHITNFNSVFNMRLRRPTNGKFSTLPSNHSFGIAIDINQGDGQNGISSAPLAPIFLKYGFGWGNNFTSPDPMHYEVNQFL
ncbi:M15 family metallopeptidase [Atlantibacter subterraneus]|uniref:M15 family metallopeptidase n=1 Tax=Atlantibacter subterraneus TaxID=255519 RepID=UPI002896A350|nr:M15 family metallopeptidase [Atlantibacter subterranea]